MPIANDRLPSPVLEFSPSEIIACDNYGQLCVQLRRFQLRGEVVEFDGDNVISKGAVAD